MKNNKVLIALAFIAILFSTASLSSCKKKSNTAAEFPSDVTSIISQNQINVLRSKGMTIYSGTTPPNVTGIYIASPYTMLSPYGSDDNYQKGDVIDDYSYQFYNQNGTTLDLNFKNTPSGGTDEASGLATIITGQGNNFSIFYQVTGSSSGVNYTQAGVVSGTFTTLGIANFQVGFILTSKSGDQGNNILEPTNSGRVWYDGDYLATVTSTYRMMNNVVAGKAHASIMSVKK